MPFNLSISDVPSSTTQPTRMAPATPSAEADGLTHAPLTKATQLLSAGSLTHNVHSSDTVGDLRGNAKHRAMATVIVRSESRTMASVIVRSENPLWTFREGYQHPMYTSSLIVEDYPSNFPARPALGSLKHNVHSFDPVRELKEAHRHRSLHAHHDSRRPALRLHSSLNTLREPAMLLTNDTQLLSAGFHKHNVHSYEAQAHVHDNPLRNIDVARPVHPAYHGNLTPAIIEHVEGQHGGHHGMHVSGNEAASRGALSNFPARPLTDLTNEADGLTPLTKATQLLSAGSLKHNVHSSDTVRELRDTAKHTVESCPAEAAALLKPYTWCQTPALCPDVANPVHPAYHGNLTPAIIKHVEGHHGGHHGVHVSGNEAASRGALSKFPARPLTYR